jgi:hypothetical protein
MGNSTVYAWTRHRSLQALLVATYAGEHRYGSSLAENVEARMMEVPQQKVRKP